MTLVYFHPTALAKLCVKETDSALAVALWEGGDTLLTSRTAHVEVRAALEAAVRIGRLGAAAAAQASERWDELWPGLGVIEVGEPLVRAAGELVRKRPLRATDALHLAAMLTVREADPLCAVWDRHLAAAARAEGLRVIPQATQ